jgi:type I restriction enzyme S subunit
MIITPETLGLPPDWLALNASEHLILETGQRPSQYVTDDPSDIPSWGGENISEEGFVTLVNQRFVSRQYLARASKGRVQPGDILLNKDGANTGKVAFVDSLPAPDVLINEHVFIIRNKGEFDQRFLFAFLHSHLGQKQLKALVVGSAQPGVSNRFTRQVLLPRPEINEQRAISTFFAEIDLTIAAIGTAIAAAERLQLGLMRELLSGRVRCDGKARPAAEFWLHDRLGHIPKRWEVRSLRELIRLKNGKSNITSNLRPSSDSNHRFPVFGGNGMTGWSDRFFLSEATVVLGRVGEYCGAIHATPPNSWVTDNALYVEERLAPLDIRFLFYLLTSLRLNRWKATTGQPKITQSEILNIRVAFPQDEDEQRAIAEQIGSLRCLIRAKEAKITALQRLKKSLMQNLLTGRMRLSSSLIAELTAGLADEKSGGA